MNSKYMRMWRELHMVHFKVRVLSRYLVGQKVKKYTVNLYRSKNSDLLP
jgi:hypothetical protein